MSKLLLIDDMVINDHYYLKLGVDKCYYFEYTADKGYSYSSTNTLILNFKKGLDKRSESQFKYKEQAIETIANLLSTLSQNSIDNSTFVPIPPSKSKSNPLYDDRLVQVLNLGLKGRNADIRELINQMEDTEAYHKSGKRDIQALENVWEIDETLTNGLRKYIIIFDDILTTGCHYVAMKNMLLKRFPKAKIIGLFVARREIIR